MLQEDAMWNKNKKYKNLGFINKCNNPLNPKFHRSFATFTWKSNMKTLWTPFLRGEIFEDNYF